MAALAALAGFLISASAQGEGKDRAKLLALLPPYCKHTQLYRRWAPGGDDPAQIARWQAAMGGNQNFSHLHHYCMALDQTNRALYFERSKIERDRALRGSLSNFDYVIRNVQPDFALLPEIFTRKGENLIRLGRAHEGVVELIRAIDLNPGYWPPYAAMSDYYRDAGESAAAREWLEKGLKAVPEAGALKRRLAELNAKGAR